MYSKLIPFEIMETSKLKNGYFYVYALAEPDEEHVRYVGRSFDLYKRKEQHIREALECEGEGAPRNRWIYNLLKQGREPRLLIVCACGSLTENKFMERFWIGYYARTGAGLLNRNFRKEDKAIDAIIDIAGDGREAYHMALDAFYAEQKRRIEKVYQLIRKENEHLAL